MFVVPQGHGISKNMNYKGYIMKQILVVAGVIGMYLLLQLYILPKLGFIT